MRDDDPPELVTIGESMLRLTPVDGSPLERAGRLDVDVAGAESNVAVAFARLGHRAAWVSRLPKTALGRLVASRIGEHGVDLSRVLWADRGSRLGIYYFESKIPPRPGRVIYDRADSAFARIDPDEVDWDFVGSARRLHLTGITPALGPACRELVERALEVARRRGQAVSFDLNYRTTLWEPQTAAPALTDLLKGVGLLFASSRDARSLFGLDGTGEQQAAELARRLRVQLVVVTCAENGAAAWDGRGHRVQAFRSVEVDRIGRGDAFVAGFLHRIGEGNTDEALRYGSALAALKQTYRGDFVWATPDELEAVVRSDEHEVER